MAAAVAAIFHGLVVVIIFIGVFFALLNKLKKWPLLEKAYLSCAVLMIVSYVFTRGCYLTNIEQWLWLKGQSPFAYSGGYISHYLGLVGIRVDDGIVYWVLVYSLILGLGSYIVRYSLIKLKE